MNDVMQRTTTAPAEAPDGTERAALQDNYLRREFPSRVAHDIRSPLGIIAGTLAELRRAGDNLDPAQRQLLDLTQRAAKQLQRIADRLSLVARLEGDKLEWEPRDVDLAQVVEQAVEEIGQTRRRRSVNVQVHVQDGLPLVPGDATLLARACEELVDNAIRHARKQVDIRVEAVPGAVVLHVGNDGSSSIEAGDDLFVRFIPDASRAGLGLGLSFVRDIAQRHGGTVELASTEPVTFRLSIPTQAPH